MRATPKFGVDRKKFVQPAMSVAKGLDEDRTRVGAHRAGAGIRIVCRLNNLTLAIRRGRRPRKRQRSCARFRLRSL